MTDSQICSALRSLLSAEDKPKELTPLDLLQLTRLILQGADEKHIYPSQDTLADQLCTSADSIARSSERLNDLGWLIVRKGGYRGRTNLYAVDLSKLPTAQLTRTVVSEHAKQIAAQVGNHLRVSNRKKFMRGWLQQWAFQFQKLIDKTEGGAEQVVQLVNFAFSHPIYAKKAMRGPAELRRVWKQLTEDFKKAGQQ